MCVLTIGQQVMFIPTEGEEEEATVAKTHPHAMGEGKPAVDLELSDGEMKLCITKVGALTPSPFGSWRHLTQEEQNHYERFAGLDY